MEIEGKTTRVRAERIFLIRIETLYESWVQVYTCDWSEVYFGKLFVNPTFCKWSLKFILLYLIKIITTNYFHLFHRFIKNFSSVMNKWKTGFLEKCNRIRGKKVIDPKQFFIINENIFKSESFSTNNTLVKKHV